MTVIRNGHNTIRAAIVRGHRTGHDNIDNRVTGKPVLKNMQSLKLVKLTEGISNNSANSMTNCLQMCEGAVRAVNTIRH